MELPTGVFLVSCARVSLVNLDCTYPDSWAGLLLLEGSTSDHGLYTLAFFAGCLASKLCIPAPGHHIYRHNPLIKSLWVRQLFRYRSTALAFGVWLHQTPALICTAHPFLQMRLD